MVSFHQFIGRAYLWAEITRVLHRLPEEHLLEWVVDVREVPSQQDADAVDCRNRDVQRVLRKLIGYRLGGEELSGKIAGFLIDIEHGERRNGGKAFPRQFLVPTASLIVYQG